MGKVSKQLDEERKAYCVDFRQSLSAYLEIKGVHTVQFEKNIAKYIKDLDALNLIY